MSARTSGAVVTVRATRRSGGEIETDAARPRLLEGARVAASPAGHVQHAPAVLEAHPLRDERHRPPGLGGIAMRIELQVLFTEPLLEPFGHSRSPAPL
jgi:hypothetical protein